MRVLFLLSLFIITTSAQAMPTAYIASYNALLSNHVSKGEAQGITGNLVDYGAWAQDARHKQAMDLLLSVNPAPLTGKDKLTFWINAYNLLTVDLIISKQEKRSIKKIGGVFGNPWKDNSWTISGKDYTLDHIEHKILRTLDEPRIHMAINCASLSCPDLRNEAYRADTLDVQLQEQTELFLASTSKGVVATSDGYKLSKIFDWFGEDFGNEKDIVAFVKANNTALPDTNKIDAYIKYNWSLNGRW